MLNVLIVFESVKKMTSKRKLGCIDRIIEKLPEIHFRGYRYCGPNTNLALRLAHGEHGVNELDCACMDHDIAYAVTNNPEMRCKADKILALKAFRRIFAKNSRIGERFTALIVSWLIAVKLFLAKTEIYIRKFCSTFKTRRKK